VNEQEEVMRDEVGPIQFGSGNGFSFWVKPMRRPIQLQQVRAKPGSVKFARSRIRSIERPASNTGEVLKNGPARRNLNRM
jgi:hypothetical protein